VDISAFSEYSKEEHNATSTVISELRRIFSSDSPFEPQGRDCFTSISFDSLSALQFATFILREIFSHIFIYVLSTKRSAKQSRIIQRYTFSLST